MRENQLLKSSVLPKYNPFVLPIIGGAKYVPPSMDLTVKVSMFKSETDKCYGIGFSVHLSNIQIDVIRTIILVRRLLFIRLFEVTTSC